MKQIPHFVLTWSSLEPEGILYILCDYNHKKKQLSEISSTRSNKFIQNYYQECCYWTTI